MKHELRDKYGRFSKKATTSTPKRKNTKKQKSTTASVILNGFLLDSSGSMMYKEKSVIEGFNELVEQGKKDVIATGVINKQFMAFFGTGYKPVDCEVDKLFKGRSGEKVSYGIGYNSDMGGTALWESTYKLITKLESELSNNPGAKVILTIFTDKQKLSLN